MSPRRVVAALISSSLVLALAPPLMASAAIAPVTPATAPAPASTLVSLDTSMVPLAAAAKSSSTSIRVATFNVRTARATKDKRNWFKRAPDVAKEIVATRPGVVALQELGPGRADGKTGKLLGHIRQTDHLLATLKKHGGGRYKLVRTSAYIAPGTKNSTQGARILYDSSRYSVVTNCPNTTGKRNYNTSCKIHLPLLSGDGQTRRRQAAYAQLKDKRTGKTFFVVSAHLDDRHSGKKSTELKYQKLRAKQVSTILSTITKLNTKKVPVIFGGDLNSWKRSGFANAPRDTLKRGGFADPATFAKKKINLAYSTVNHFEKTQKRSKKGLGAQLDVVMIKGMKSTSRFENKTKVTDTTRPSDHNMVIVDVVI